MTVTPASDENWSPSPISDSCAPDVTPRSLHLAPPAPGCIRGCSPRPVEWPFPPAPGGGGAGPQRLLGYLHGHLWRPSWESQALAFGRGMQSHRAVTTLPVKSQCCLMKGLLVQLSSWHCLSPALASHPPAACTAKGERHATRLTPLRTLFIDGCRISFHTNAIKDYALHHQMLPEGKYNQIMKDSCYIAVDLVDYYHLNKKTESQE